MANRSDGTVVGVFRDSAQAQQAVNELKRLGFDESQIGVVGPGSDTDNMVPSDAGDNTYASEGAVSGLAAGAGVGALWGLGILAGVLPAIGPAIAGGTLAAILSSTAAGAAAAGLGGALIGLGLSKEEADYYNSEFESGRTVVTVTAGSRRDEVESILQGFGGYDMSNRGEDSLTSDAYPTGSAFGGSTSSSDLSGSGSSTMGSTGRPYMGANADSGDFPSTTPASGALGTGSAGSGSSSTSRSNTAQGSSNQGTGSQHVSGQHSGSQSSKREGHITAYDEELHVDKTPVEKGSVNIRKEVHTEHKTIDVPVQREEVVVERRPASGQSGAMGSAQDEIHIPIREEQVRVDKQRVAKEDVAVSKRTVNDTEHIDETLRKEEIKVDRDPNIRVDDRRNKNQ